MTSSPPLSNGQGSHEPGPQETPMQPSAPESRQADVVIVGASHAGIECAWTLRSAGFAGSILLIDAEDALPYQKPPLSKAMLAGTTDAERLALRSPDAYQKQAITHLPGVAVTRLLPDAQRLSLSDGSSARYTHCVLATGARARPLPGLDGPGIHSIRTLADALALKPLLAAGTRLLVIGGGYLGLEAASTAAKAGARVTVLELSPALMSGKVSAHTSSAFEALHHASGIDVRRGASPVSRWERAGDEWRAHLDDGRCLPADQILVCIGALPNDELARAAGLRCDNGIVVDAACRTSAPGVYAIGDCASSFRPQWQCFGRVESVQNALEHARTAAAAIAGAPPPAPKAPTFWSEQQGRRLQMAGLAHPGSPCEDRVTATAKGWLVERYQDGLLAVVEAVDSPVEFMQASKRLGTPAPALASPSESPTTGVSTPCLS